MIIRDRKHAVSEALYLAVTAESDSDSLKAVALAEQLAQGLSEKEIETIKRQVEKRLKEKGN